VTPADDLPAGWLTQFRRGVLSGAGLLLLAVAVCAIPSFLVWLVPGADTTPATSAVKSGALLALAAAHGGIRLNGVQVTLVPLLLTALLGWLIAGQARRSESWSSVVGLAVGYGACSGLLAQWATLGSTRAPSDRSGLAGFVFVAVIGGASRAMDGRWPTLSDRHQRISRATAAVLTCYLGAGALLVTGSLLWHFHDAVVLQRQVAPGVAGLPVALLGIAAAPNAVLAAVAYLSGSGFTIGSHASVSAVAVQHGALPDFPLLAAIPVGASATAIGIGLIAAVAMLAGWLGTRLLSREPSWPGRIADLGCVAVLTGGSLAVLTAVAAGGIGDGALSQVGGSWWAVGGSMIMLVVLSSSVWLAVELLRGKPAAESPAKPAAKSPAKPAAKSPAKPAAASGEPAPSLRIVPAAEPEAPAASGKLPAAARVPATGDSKAASRHVS
jgi:hypothetical protein